MSEVPPSGETPAGPRQAGPRQAGPRQVGEVHVPLPGLAGFGAEVVLNALARPPSAEELTVLAAALAVLVSTPRSLGDAAGAATWRFSGRWWKQVPAQR